jgi:hypothetical protein
MNQIDLSHGFLQFEAEAISFLKLVHWSYSSSSPDSHPDLIHVTALQTALGTM